MTIDYNIVEVCVLNAGAAAAKAEAATINKYTAITATQSRVYSSRARDPGGMGNAGTKMCGGFGGADYGDHGGRTRDGLPQTTPLYGVATRKQDLDPRHPQRLK